MKKLILLLSLIFYSSITAQNNVSMNFILYQNAANNMIAMTGSFPIIYTGTVSGYSYYFKLEQPTVQFNQGYLKMIAKLKINTSITGELEFNIQPYLYVNYSISTDDVTAYLDDFDFYINSVLTSVPQWVRDKIIEQYESLELKMYPVKLLDFVESYIPDYLDIEVTNIGFASISNTGQLQITIDFDLTGIEPFYQCYTYNKTQIKITSNVRVDIKRLTLYLVGGDTYYDFNGTAPISKDGAAIFNCFNPSNTLNTLSGRYIRVLLQSDVRGTFLRLYNAAYMYNTNDWTGPKPFKSYVD